MPNRLQISKATLLSPFFAARIVPAVVIVIVGLLIWGAAYTVKSGTIGVLATFGKFSDSVEAPGIHFKVPIIQNVFIEDVKMQTATYKGNRDLADQRGIVNKPQITVMDAKNLPIGIEMSVQYTPNQADMPAILRTFGSNYYEKKINPIVRAITRDVIGKYEAETIAIERQKIASELKASFAKEFDALPFVLNDVVLRNIRLPNSVQKKIMQVQEAKQEEERLKMAEKQAQVKKRIQIVDAEREAAKKVIAAKADAERKVIAANADATRITVRSKAIAEANDRVSKSLTPLLVKQHGIEKWDGAYPKTLLGQNTPLLVSLPGK